MAKKRAPKRKNHSKPRKPGTPLTPREIKVLKWTGKGYTKAEAGSRLGTSMHGVDWHTRKICRKLGAINMTHAVYKACQRGLI